MLIVTVAVFISLKTSMDTNTKSADAEDAELISYIPFIVFAVLLLNGCGIVYLARKALKLLLFPYGSSYIKQQFHQQMNMKMTSEMKNNILKVNAVVLADLAQRCHVVTDNT